MYRILQHIRIKTRILSRDAFMKQQDVPGLSYFQAKLKFWIWLGDHVNLAETFSTTGRSTTQTHDAAAPLTFGRQGADLATRSDFYSAHGRPSIETQQAPVYSGRQWLLL